MNKTILRTGLACLLCLGLASCGGDYDDEIDELRDAQSDSEAQIDSLQSDLDTTTAELDATEAELAALRSEFSNGKAINLTILHMNDHHSHLKADDFELDVSGLELTSENNGEDISTAEVSFGGFPLLTNAIRAVEGQRDNVLKLHAGDAITGTLYYSLFKGAADAAVMNEICFDAFALGNHEFDDGDSGLANFLDSLNSSACNTPALAANVQPGETSAIYSGYIEPYTTFKFEGETVGVIGIDIAGKTKNSSSPDDDTVFLDELTTAQAQIDALENMGINKIILLTHITHAMDLEIAAQLTGVDVIVGGDSHTLLGGETFSNLGFNPSGDYPAIASNADGETVCVVTAWEYARIFGVLDVSFDGDGVVTACSGNPIVPVSSNYVFENFEENTTAFNLADSIEIGKALAAYPEISVVNADSTVENMLAAFDAEVSVLEQTSIGTVGEDLCLVRWPGDSRSSICDVADTYEHGSDISNIVAKAFLMVTPSADIAIQNGGGVRVDVPAGDYTIADAFTLLPFSNTLVTLEMTGQQVVNVLEDALANTLDNAGSTGSYPYASGLRYNVDASATAGNRVSAVEVNSRLAGTWTAIDLAATYTVATNDFIASGQDGYTTFSVPNDAGNFVNTYTEYAQGFIDYVNSLTADSTSIVKLPVAEYSTQVYIGRDGCNHSTQTDCVNY